MTTLHLKVKKKDEMKEVEKTAKETANVK